MMKPTTNPTTAATISAPAMTRAAILSGALWIGSPSSGVGKSVDGSITGAGTRVLTDVDMRYLLGSMQPRGSGGRDVERPSRPRDPTLGRRPERSSEQVDELLDPRRAALLLVRVPMEQTGVELGRDERVLQALGQPVDHRGGHLDVQVGAYLAPPHAELDEVECPVGVLAHEEPVDLALQPQVGPVVADQR